jgi:transposase
MRTHICPNCALVLDRDYHAALNIVAVALALVAAQNRTAGQAKTGIREDANASGQTASTAVFARARRKRVG